MSSTIRAANEWIPQIKLPWSEKKAYKCKGSYMLITINRTLVFIRHKLVLVKGSLDPHNLFSSSIEKQQFYSQKYHRHSGEADQV